MTIISPSILSADFSDLKTDIKRVEPFVEWIHLDVMDGHFVSNITFGPDLVKCVRKSTNLFLDTHLMIENPIKYVEAFKNAGSDLITIHVEATKENTLNTIEKIKSLGIKAGISIKPKTPVLEILQYINLVDLVLVMTVEPGFGGQGFILECSDKISQIREINKDIIIQVDGGINDKTAKIAKEDGANCLVAGSYIYKSQNIEQAIKSLL